MRSGRVDVGRHGRLLAVALVGAAFGLLVLLVSVGWGPLLAADRSTAVAANALVSPRPAAVTVLRWVTALGSPTAGAVLITVATVRLVLRGAPWPAFAAATTGVGIAVLNTGMKALVARARPVVAVTVTAASGHSFPSGHALTATVALGVAALVVLPDVGSRTRPVVVAVAGLLVAAVGLTRVALGVHFLSDVVGGWLLGLLWLALTHRAIRPDLQ